MDPAENLPKFIEELEAAGINEIIAEKQKQLDEFLAGK
jgi:putative aldouronate transport system substrate-binding protein